MGKVWGIVGGGFGLYGYLPALRDEENASQILILEKHMPFVNSREDLRECLPQITAVKSRNEIFEFADSLILSVPPLIQEQYIFQPIFKKYQNLLLEKPLSPTPQSSIEMLERGISTSSSLRIGYSFSYSKWGQEIYGNNVLLQSGDFEFLWFFSSHHYINKYKSWKSDHKAGGGALRFYGIQLIAFISLMGDVDVESSILEIDKNGEAFKWFGVLKIKNGARISIKLNSHHPESLFQLKKIGCADNILVDLKNPFELEKINCGRNGDERVPILKKILDSFEEVEDLNQYSSYDKINRLWLEIENVTISRYL